MNEITFNDIPAAIGQLFDKLETICQKIELLQKAKPAPQLIEEEKEVWFSLQELLEYLPTKPKAPTVYGWICSKKIPYHKRGGRLYFSKNQIDAWIKSGRKQTSDDMSHEVDKFLFNQKSK
ncbi:MAG: DNA-binding protein [Sphingobacteriales bacterium]|nr:MAG: DNA-binding protein [Sphingobacteriales bacterium]